EGESVFRIVTCQIVLNLRVNAAIFHRNQRETDVCLKPILPDVNQSVAFGEIEELPAIGHGNTVTLVANDPRISERGWYRSDGWRRRWVCRTIDDEQRGYRDERQSHYQQRDQQYRTNARFIVLKSGRQLLYVGFARRLCHLTVHVGGRRDARRSQPDWRTGFRDNGGHIVGRTRQIGTGCGLVCRFYECRREIARR